MAMRFPVKGSRVAHTIRTRLREFWRVAGVGLSLSL